MEKESTCEEKGSGCEDEILGKFVVSELKSIHDPNEKRLKKFKIHSVLFGVESNATHTAPQVVTHPWSFPPSIQYQAPGNSMQFGYGPNSPAYSVQSFDSSSNNEAQ